MSYSIDIDELLESLVSMIDENDECIGTGFFLTTDGYVITCHHVIYIQKKIRFKYKQKVYCAEYVANLSRPNLDIAILKADVVCERVLGMVYEPKKDEKCDLVGFSIKESNVFVNGQVIRERLVDKGEDISLVSTFDDSFSGFVGNIDERRDWNVCPTSDAIFKSYSVDYEVEKGFSGGMMVGCDSGRIFGVIQSTRYLETRGIRISVLRDVFEHLGVDVKRCQKTRVVAPDYFVYRKNKYEDIKRKVLDVDTQNDQGVVVLHGFGGYGKSVLGSCICNDEDVVEAFRDGVYGAVFGPDNIDDKSISGVIKEIIGQITGKDVESFEFEYLQHKLVDVVGDKHILLFLDDIWSGVQLLPFMSVCKNCVRLITTRNKEIFHEFSKRVVVNEMNPEEAYDLLVHKITDQIHDNEKYLLRNLCKRLRYWPQVISLLNGRLVARTVIHNQRLIDAINALEVSLDEKGLTAYDSRDNGFINRNNAIRACVEVSLQDMGDDRKRLYELSVLYDNSEIPIDLVAMIWARTAQMSNWDTEELCQVFYNKSLVNALNLDKRLIGVHDNVLWYIRSAIKNSDCDLRLINGAIIDGMYEKYGFDLVSVPANNMYIWRNIIKYYADSGRTDEAMILLKNYLWISKKISILGVYKLLDDYYKVRADEVAERIFDALYLSADIIARYPDQLPYQLWGRLKYYDDGGMLDFLGDVEAAIEKKKIKMLFPSLTPPSSEKFRITNHKGAVNGSIYCVIDNCRSIITCSDDRSVMVWDANFGYLKYPIERHNEGVSLVSCTDDGYFIVTALKDNSINIYNALSGEVKKISKHYDAINSIKLSSDGKMLVTGAKDGFSYVWSVDDSKLLYQLDEGVISVNDIALSMNSLFVVTVSGDNVGRVWDISSGKLISQLVGHEGAVNKVTVTPDDQKIITVSDDCSARVWSLTTGEQLSVIQHHTAPVIYVDCTASGDRFVTASDDNTVALWDLKNNELIEVLQGHLYPVKIAKFSNNDQYLVTASSDNSLCLWHSSDGQIFLSLQGHIGGINDVHFSEDDQEIVSASDDMTSRIWRIKKYQSPKRLSNFHYSSINYLLFSRSGKFVISSSYDNSIKIWDASKGEVVRQISEYPMPVEIVLFSNNENILAVSSLDNLIYINFIANHPDVVIRCHAGIKSMSFSNDSQMIVVAFADNLVKVFSVYTGQEICVFDDHERFVVAVLFSHDDKKVLTASDDGTARIFEIQKKEYSTVLFGGDKRLLSIACSDNHENVVILSVDATLSVVDSALGCELFRLVCSRELDGHVTSLFVVNAGISLDSDHIYAFLRYSFDDNDFFWRAMVYNFEGKCILSTKQNDGYLESAYMLKGGFNQFVCALKNTILYYDLKSDCVIDSLHFDYDLSALSLSDDTIVAGDKYGRIHFCKIK